ncbi:MAG: hypothetical protein ACTSV2_14870 [Candidatus Thorarchaeota archaeon]
MFRKHKIIVLAFLFGLLFVSINAMPTHALSDDFPIGLNLNYVLGWDLPPNQYESRITYSFLRWIDQESLTVEYEQDNTTYVRNFHEILLPGPDRPPLWMDISTWSVGDYVELSGRYYPIIMMEDRIVGPRGTHECFRLEVVFQTIDRECASSFWYHAQMGLLVDYTRVDRDILSYEMIEGHSGLLIDGNFLQFNPPTFTVQEPTQTTTTTTTTTTTITTTTTSTASETTSQNRQSVQPSMNIIVALSVGIVIECIIIVLIFMRKKSSNT